MEYFEQLAAKMNQLPLDPECHNVVTTDGKGGYEVKTFEVPDNGGSYTFDDILERVAKVNSLTSTEGRRIIFVSTPNRWLRVLGGCQASMITFCTPMNNSIIPTIGIKAKGRLGDEYIIPMDKRQDAADMVTENDDLLPLAEMVMEGLVEIDGKTPFTGV